MPRKASTRENNELKPSSSLSSLFSLNGKSKQDKLTDDNASIRTNSSRKSLLKRPESLLSLVSPLMKKRKSFVADDAESSGSSSSAANSAVGTPVSRRPSKRQRRLSLEQEAALKKRIEEEEAAAAAKEEALDEELEPEYRKFRPKGYHLNPPPSDRPIRVYADGVFDLFHLGHMKQLEQAKKALPNTTLVVGVPGDVVTHKLKGLTVLNEEQRYESVAHCKWVDEVIKDAPWCVTPEFLAEHEIDYVAHDDLPYAGADSDDIYRPVKEAGKFLVTQRTEGVSTSDIITKVIRDYDKYLMRNFARGASRQELNVSWLKKNELDFKRHVNQFRDSFKNNFETASKDLYGDLMGYLSGVLQASPAGASAIARRSGFDRGRKAISDSEMSVRTSDEDDTPTDVDSSVVSDATSTKRPRMRSPISDFASKYSRRKAKGGILDNMRGWVKSRRSSSDGEVDAEEEKDEEDV